ncbi:hypothetical protein GYMLUDRAFT_257702 [Collybiopsis luxurians FD-317 M1]|nr:hypothetical protein GYMLUDRAFT_257702 [Collybiopsis luxurians FD-317 M1]
MCHGNLAQASANFINAQLSALWENSKACNDKEPHKKESKDIVTKHGTALREFYDESGSASLHAIFQIPHLEFLCNHELVLFLRVENGQYKVKKSRHGLKNTTLAVRLSYHFQDLSASLGGKHCDISILSFNPSSATLIAESSVLNHGQSHDFDALSLLLKNHYIPTLIDAGHLNLLVLPPSYTGKKEIDHGVIASRILPRSLLFGTQVAKLNEILNHHWLAAIRYHDAHKEVVSTELRDTYLSQYKVSWLDGDLWAIYQFSPLRLQVLCETEVIMHFKADIQVYRDDAEKELHSVLKDWEIAVIFRVVNKDGHVVLDRFHPPRIASHSCSLPCQPLEGNLDEVFRREFKLSILHTYVELIFQFGHYQLYPDFHEPSDPEPGHEDHEGRRKTQSMSRASSRSRARR